ncbi:MAG: cytochrome b N-terminal domain-containing protein [Anaerolineae bacterium]|nr:cytochrome b N-terminal domain-containing protein [Anaerolineae bacterium]
MATIFEQISEMGLKQALVTKTDEVVERLTAGMNISDVRGALRGDEPRRPNPRLRPHADGFWFHIRPSFYHTEVTHIYPTFRLGWLSTFMMVWETITGILLMIFYTPSPLIAYGDMWNILSNVPMGQLMRNMHRLGAEVMVLVVALHMLRTFITGSYKKPRQFTWATGVILLTLTALLSFSGYLLPWDQLAYWALTVFLSGAEAAPAPPVVNQNILFILQGGPALGAGGLLRWYLFHVLLLPLLLGVFFFVHYYKVILHGLSLPPGREEIGEDTAKRVPKDERTYFTPDILTSELMWTALLTLFLIAGSLWFWDAPLETHADPVVTPLHVVAPWYLSWSQGWLKLAPKTVVVGFIPLLLVAFIVMPYFEVGKSRRYADRRVGLSVSFLFIAFMLVSNWMGSPEFRVESSPEREVSQGVLPQEGPSVLKGVPYEHLELGTYVPGQVLEDNPHLTRALAVFYNALYRQSCKLGDGNPDLPYNWYPCEEEVLENGEVRYGNHFTDNAMPNPYAELRITQEQENMVKLTLYYEVVNPQRPEELLIESDEAVGYRHEDSLYEEECQFLNKNC